MFPKHKFSSYVIIVLVGLRDLIEGEYYIVLSILISLAMFVEIVQILIPNNFRKTSNSKDKFILSSVVVVFSILIVVVLGLEFTVERSYINPSITVEKTKESLSLIFLIIYLLMIRFKQERIK